MSIANSEYGPEITLSIDLDSRDEEAQAVTGQIIPFEYDRGDRSYLRWLCAQPGTPEATLFWLCDKQEFAAELGHRKGPRKVLEQIVERYGYPEAVLTLGRESYTASVVSDAEFADFLDRHVDDGWLLGTLARLDASSPAKDRALDEIIRRHPDVETLRQTRRIRSQLREAEQSSSGARLQELFESRVPDVWLALAENPRTPEIVLRSLMAAQGIKSAKQIRQLAQRNLELRSG
jgi:hypothetical protein